MTEPLSLVLADCLDALDRGDTLEACLARHPQQRTELAELLMAAQHLHAAPNATPSPQFQRVARARLMNRISPRAHLNGLAPVTLADSFRSSWQTLILNLRRPAMRWIAMLMLATMLLGGVSAAYASAEALPGEGLYPVKRALEGARLAVAFSASEAAELRVQLAGRRLVEAQALAGRGLSATEALRSYESEVRELEVIWPRVSPAQRLSLHASLALHATVLVEFDSADEALRMIESLLATLSAGSGTPVVENTPVSSSATPLPSATPSPSQIRPTLAVTVRATHIVTALPTELVTFVPDYCWPWYYPTPDPTHWPINLPTPARTCVPQPTGDLTQLATLAPSEVCWPPIVPTPATWIPGWPTPNVNCGTPAHTPQPIPDVRATLTQIATQYPTPNWQATVTAIATQFPNITPPPIPSIVVPTQWATYLPTGWPPRP